MKKILVVEDEASIRDMLELNLSLAGYEVCATGSAEEALDKFGAAMNGFDAAILDVMLPKQNGFTLCELIRNQNRQIGIIILSALSQESDKISGLSIGADDYITKPFSVALLLARVDALCRRVLQGEETYPDDNTLRMGRFQLDNASHLLYKDGNPIDLTQVEFGIMELFFQNSGVALVRDQILSAVWGENYYGDVKVVDVNIRRLRMKIEDNPSDPQHIMTVWGYGYRWNT